MGNDHVFTFGNFGWIGFWPFLGDLPPIQLAKKIVFKSAFFACPDADVVSYSPSLRHLICPPARAGLLSDRWHACDGVTFEIALECRGGKPVSWRCS